MGRDMPCRHAFGVHGQHLILNVCDISRILFDNLRLEFTFPVSWNIEVDFTKGRGNSFLAVTISAVVSFLVMVIILGIAQFLVRFSLQYALKGIAQ